MTSEEQRSSDKMAKKVERKQGKALGLLAKDYCIGESDGPSPNILVCNAGLVTGCSQADLLAVFAKFGPVRQLLMIPKKSYSFVVFFHLQDAQVGKDFGILSLSSIYLIVSMCGTYRTLVPTSVR